MPANGATRKLAEFVAGASRQTLPGHLYPLAKKYFLDALGVIVFGSTLPWSRTVIRHGARLSGKRPRGSALVLGTDWRADPGLAALVNGTSGHAFELDDVHDESLLHPGVAVVPAALAVAEDVDASGTDMLTAVIVGYELMTRAGLGVGALSHMMGGFHSTGTNGVFGSAAAVGKLLGQDADRIAHAFGIAGSMASGIMEFSQTGGMIKRLHAGRAAEGGVLSAQLAEEGFTGPAAVLEGVYGYCSTFSRKPEPERLVAGLGKKFAIEEITVKPYACCSDQHGTVDCLRSIREKHGVTADRIKSIVIHTYDKVIKQNSARSWPTVMSAQYSVVFTAAASFFHDLGDPRSYSEQVIAEPRIAELAARVKLRKDPKFQALYPSKMPTRVTVETTDAQKFEAEVIGARGHFENPMSAAEIEAKFRRLTEGILTPSQMDAALAAVAGLDTLKSVRELSELLTVSGKGARDAAA